MVIYDAAHGYGVNYKGQSLFNYGDVSTCSFHATKIFHTGEGGALICKDQQLKERFYSNHNFGHDGPEKFHGVGINAKMSELQASMGLCVLPYMEKIFSSRKQVVDHYNDNLKFKNFRKIKIRQDTKWNYSYYPIIFESEEHLLRVLKIFNSEEISPRRYFYPSLNTLDYVDYVKMEISESISKRILCLPLYVNLPQEKLDMICTILNNYE